MKSKKVRPIRNWIIMKIKNIKMCGMKINLYLEENL